MGPTLLGLLVVIILITIALSGKIEQVQEDASIEYNSTTGKPCLKKKNYPVLQDDFRTGVEK